MTQNKDRKATIRARMSRTGEPYSEAARHIDLLEPSPAELAERGVEDARARAAAYADDSWEPESRRARLDLHGVERWEDRRAGRPVRLWEAIIETRTSALDIDDAFTRLGLYIRHPWHRTITAAGLLQSTWNIDDDASSPGPGRHELREIAPDRLSPAERRQLQLDYPVTALEHRARREPYSPLHAAHVEDYLDSLRRAARRLLGHFTPREEAELDEQRGLITLAAAPLTFWRCHHRVQFLAGYDLASARARAAELAATIVDYAGRPAARVVSIEPDDGFASAIDGLWCHPADADGYLTDALFDDYDLAEHTTGDAPALAAVLAAAAGQLDAVYHGNAGEHAEFEARLYTQPDGSRTLSTPAELAAEAAAARAEYSGASVSELRAAADTADYMADRVYGKSVETDRDFKRIERTHHRAKILRELADACES